MKHFLFVLIVFVAPPAKAPVDSRTVYFSDSGYTVEYTIMRRLGSGRVAEVYAVYSPGTGEEAAKLFDNRRINDKFHKILLANSDLAAQNLANLRNGLKSRGITNPPLLEVTRILNARFDDANTPELKAQRMTLSKHLSVYDLIPTLKFHANDNPELRAIKLQAVYNIVVQLAQGTSYLHTASQYGEGIADMVHSDIKPSNLLIESHPEVGDTPGELILALAEGKIGIKISDFETAHLLDRNTTLSRVDRLIGSAPYLDPFRIRNFTATGDSRSSYASDQWAIGLTALEMIHGELPETLHLPLGDVKRQALANLQVRIRQLGKSFEEDVKKLLEPYIGKNPKNQMETFLRELILGFLKPTQESLDPTSQVLGFSGTSSQKGLVWDGKITPVQSQFTDYPFDLCGTTQQATHAQPAPHTLARRDLGPSATRPLN